MKPSSDPTPLAYKQALEIRVRKAAAAAGLDQHRFRQSLLQDRLLARVARQFSDRALVKGGVALELRLSRTRSTRDLELHLIGSSDRLLRELKVAGELDLGDRVSFRFGESSADLRDHPHQSKRYRAEARLAGTIYGSPFGVDLSFGDLLCGSAEHIEGTRFFELLHLSPPPQIPLYPREAHLAEKLHAYTMPRIAVGGETIADILSSEDPRIKELRDLGLLAQTGPFDANGLRNAVERTFALYNTHAAPNQLHAPPQTWAALYQRMADHDRLPWPDLLSLTRAVRAFLHPLLRGEQGRWSPGSWSWRGT